MKMDVYQRITDQIVSALEQGVRPWLKPWNAEHAAGRITRPLRANGIPYQGINVIMLWLEAVANGYSAPIWMTFKQALDLGAHVRKGEHGSLVVYASSITCIESDEGTGEEAARDIRFMKGYTVFNVEQVEGLPAHYYAPAAPRLDPVARIEHAESWVAATGAHIGHGGDRAYYRISTDHVQMPPFETFRDAESHYATLAHELTHWTRHPSRLDRDFGRKRFGDEGYAREELVAELGAAFLCADLGLRLEDRADHAAYIGMVASAEGRQARRLQRRRSRAARSRFPARPASAR
jgi:antirestriction protein ArdC